MDNAANSFNFFGLMGANGAIDINSQLANNPYFRILNEPAFELPVLGSLGSPYPIMQPKGGRAVVDVVGDMRWSNRGDIDEVPYIYLNEFELNYGTWTTNIAQIIDQFSKLTSKKALDSFLMLYSGKPTGFQYRLPYLLSNNDSIRNVENSWVKSSGIGDLVSSMAGKSSSSMGAFGDLVAAGVGAGVGALTPGFGFEETYQFGSTANQSITVSFPLYNTNNVEEAFKHFSFVNLFAFQNLKTRTSLMTYIPPKIYIVDGVTLGSTYMPAAYVSSLKIDSIGTTRRLSGFAASKEILIPEAYKVSITFTDLLSQSSNVFAGTLGGSKVTVVGDASEIIKNSGLGKAGTEFVNSVIQYGSRSKPPVETLGLTQTQNKTGTTV